MIFASKNLHKVLEIQAILCDFPYEIYPAPSFISAPKETGATFTENALIKAYHTAEYVDLPVIADDSGLEIDVLNGAPGIFSSRYSGENATDKSNIEKVLHKLKSIPKEKRIARFHCVAVCVRDTNDKLPIICHGIWEGSILFEPHGIKGFGYDPIFYVSTHNCSAAELPFEIKNQISHRGQAFKKLMEKLEERC